MADSIDRTIRLFITGKLTIFAMLEQDEARKAELTAQLVTLSRAFDELSEQDRTILRSRFKYEMSWWEVSDTVGLCERNCRRHYNQRFKLRVKNDLEKTT